MSSWADFKKELKASEGEVRHMYLDTVGAVTVGVGNMLPNVGEAQKLPFLNRESKSAATKAEIETDFTTVKAQAKGLKAAAYEKHTKLDLPAHEIDKLLDSRIDGFKRDLKVKFPKFDSYPLTVQFALLDMAFNLGISGLINKFPSFKKAVEAEDWNKAAKESNRPQLSPTRNGTVKKWLEDAAKSKKPVGPQHLG